MTNSIDDTDSLLRRAAKGDQSAVATLFDRHRDRLKSLIAVRLDRRVAGRVDPSDVIQDAMLDASQAIGQFLVDRPLPFYPWLRQIAISRLMQVHRFHLGTQRRSVKREVGLAVDDRSGEQLAHHFAAKGFTPAEQAEREDNRRRIQQAVDKLGELDREVLVLRYVEHLSTTEAAAVMGIRPDAYRQRHLRALKRLRHLFEKQGGAA